jgi:hypothetical protein
MQSKGLNRHALQGQTQAVENLQVALDDLPLDDNENQLFFGLIAFVDRSQGQEARVGIFDLRRTVEAQFLLQSLHQVSAGPLPRDFAFANIGRDSLMPDESIVAAER